MDRRIKGYYLDEEIFWVVEFECGDNEHVRYRPRMVDLHWVNHEKSRKERLGALLACIICNSELFDGVGQETSSPFSQSPE
jgi:hypothetical protein